MLRYHAMSGVQPAVRLRASDSWLHPVRVCLAQCGVLSSQERLQPIRVGRRQVASWQIVF